MKLLSILGFVALGLLPQVKPIVSVGSVAPAFTATDGVVWLLVSSSAQGFHSYLTPEDSRTYRAELKISPTAMLLDPSGTVGRRYGVITALHMVVVDPTGKVAYNGAIDDQPKTEAASLAIATNYVDAALTALDARQAVRVPTSVP